jgi:hypothetical protein
MSVSSVTLDSLPGGVSIYVNGASGKDVLFSMKKRQARALANRILQECDYQDGLCQRRPSSPHLHFNEIYKWEVA